MNKDNRDAKGKAGPRKKKIQKKKQPVVAEQWKRSAQKTDDHMSKALGTLRKPCQWPSSWHPGTSSLQCIMGAWSYVLSKCGLLVMLRASWGWELCLLISYLHDTQHSSGSRAAREIPNWLRSWEMLGGQMGQTRGERLWREALDFSLPGQGTHIPEWGCSCSDHWPDESKGEPSWASQDAAAWTDLTHPVT